MNRCWCWQSAVCSTMYKSYGVDTLVMVARKILGYCFGYCLLQKASKWLKIPANGFRDSRSFSFVGSRRFEEFRRGQKTQTLDFESAAYANFATPAAKKTNYLPKLTTFADSCDGEISWGSASNKLNLGSCCTAWRLYSTDRCVRAVHS